MLTVPFSGYDGLLMRTLLLIAALSGTAALPSSFRAVVVRTPDHPDPAHMLTSTR